MATITREYQQDHETDFNMNRNSHRKLVPGTIGRVLKIYVLRIGESNQHSKTERMTHRMSLTKCFQYLTQLSHISDVQ